MIPKVIHQTWKTEDVPDEWKKGQESVIRMNPGWTYILWTDEMCRNLIATEFPWFLDIYDSYPDGIQRADAWRYFVLYRIGGIYLDLDFYCNKPIESLFTDQECDVYLVRSANYAGMTNAILASKQYSNFWPHLWKLMVKRAKDQPFSYKLSRHYRIMKTTGPVLVDDALKTYDGVVSLLPSILVISLDACGNKNRDIEEDTVERYFTTLPGKSWHSFDSTIVEFGFCHWKIILLVTGFLLGILVFYFFRRLYTCETVCPFVR